jgi:aspartyl aminopeptidase
VAVSLAVLFAFISVERPSNGLNAFVAYDGVLVGGDGLCGPRSNFLSTVLDRIGCKSTFYRKGLLFVGDSV